MEEAEEHIIQLIYKYCKRNIAQSEYNSLTEWLQQDEANKFIFAEYLALYKRVNRYKFIQRYDELKIWEQINLKVHKRKSGIFKKWMSIAAVLAVLLGSSYSLYTLFSGERDMPIVEVAQIEAGRYQAILKTSDGVVYTMDSLKSFQASDGTLVSNSSNQLIYHNLKNTVEQLKYNTLVVPRKGEYQLQLSDGTKIWLNSESELVYPIQFGAGERVVELKGEAYFEVAKDKERPFIVKSRDANVRVLGTSFNVRSYDEEVGTQTTLVEGKVALVTPQSSFVLQPGQQGICKKGDENIQVYTVDTRLYTAWKDGMFRFKNMPLEEIMETFSRWYGVEVQFEKDHLKKLHFTGNLKRYKNINPHLNMITLTTDVKFSVKEDVIMVMQK